MTTLSASVPRATAPTPPPAPVRVSNGVLLALVLYIAALLAGASASAMHTDPLAVGPEVGTVWVLHVVAGLLALLATVVLVGVIGSVGPYRCCSFCGWSFPVQDLTPAVGNRHACDDCCAGDARVVQVLTHDDRRLP